MDEEKKPNKNEEFVAKCPHVRRFKLGRMKDSSEVDLLKQTIQTDTNDIGYNLDTVQIRSSTRVRKPNSKFAGEEWA